MGKIHVKGGWKYCMLCRVDFTPENHRDARAGKRLIFDPLCDRCEAEAKREEKEREARHKQWVEEAPLRQALPPPGQHLANYSRDFEDWVVLFNTAADRLEAGEEVGREALVDLLREGALNTDALGEEGW